MINQRGVMQVKKEDFINLIQKELKENPNVKSSDIAKKHRIPFILVELYRREIKK